MLRPGGVALPLVAMGSWRALFWFKHQNSFSARSRLAVSGLNEEENQDGKAWLPPWENVGHGKETWSLWCLQLALEHRRSCYNCCARDTKRV